jgi:3-hydroxyacyl-CoA dehydrogenase / enoyl-CoA hydratase / 3-hydroxybutyryl-CoA epimerase
MVFALYIGGMAFFQTRHAWIKQLGDGVLVLFLDREQSPFNFLDFAVLDDLDRALDKVIQAADVRLLVIRSAKQANFCYGPSPTLLASWQRNDFLGWTRRGQELCNKLAEMATPSACVISGSCCDAGLELALACDHRVLVNREATVLGFPELEWGMIPCWGATQRLPHLIGLENGLQMLLTGHRFAADQAWTFGLADDLVEEASEEPPAFLANPVKRDWTAFPQGGWRERWLESNRPGRWFLFRGAERILRRRIPDEMPAQAEMLQALRTAYQNAGFSAGLNFERHAMGRIYDHPAMRHLLRLLNHREQLRQPAISASGKPRIQTIGINGSGMAGLALLLHSITKGYDVVLRAEDETALGAALTQVIQLLQAEVESGDMTTGQFQKNLGAIRGTYTWTHFDKLDMLLDTTAGSLAEKKDFYQEAEAEIPAGALIVPITGLHRAADLQHGLQRPERLVVVNLIEPWSRVSVAEIVTSPGVAPANLQRVREWAVALGKLCLQVPDRAGGVVMRVWLPALNEAGILIKEGVPIERIDKAMRRFGMTYGPCEWMDRLGLDLVAELADALRETFTGRLAFESGFSLMTEKQWLGNRTEVGFYRKKRPNADAIGLWRTHSQGEAAHPVPSLSEADALAWIQRRLVTLMMLEAIRCLQEGLVRDADDLDCALCLSGWATHRGGPLGHARQLGADVVKAQSEELAREYGPRFAPLASLRDILKR